jgi:hypothetical protein
MRHISTILMPITVTLLLITASSDAAKPNSKYPGWDIPAYSGDSGKLIVDVLLEIKSDAEHYGEQVVDYDRAMLAMRIAALISSVAAAILLAATKVDWSRRAALILTIVAASVPAADQIFQVSDNDRSSWKAAVDSRRLFDDCKRDWESNSKLSDQNDQRIEIATQVSSRCHSDLARIVDTEMETSLKALQLPAKIEVKAPAG